MGFSRGLISTFIVLFLFFLGYGVVAKARSVEVIPVRLGINSSLRVTAVGRMLLGSETEGRQSP